MDVLLLARMQFATTVGLHWLFVMFTLGLAPLVAILHTRSALTRRPDRRDLLEQMTRFWGQLYVINYVLGIVTGLVMEFQFGLAWSGLSEYAGNVFGAPLALEALIAFFAESTFLGMWIFGWNKLPRAIHVTLIWLVTLTAYASAYWILVANGFMQNPVGSTTIRGRGEQAAAHLTDVGALLTNPSALLPLAHIAGAAMLGGGLVMAGVSAHHFLRRSSHQEFFTRSLRLGVVTAAIGSFVSVGFGFAQFPLIGRTQPTKFAGGEEAAALQRQLTARYGPGDYLPPEWIAGALEGMIVTGQLMLLAGLVALPLLARNWLVRFRPLAHVLVASIPLPFIVAIAGWVVREVGRQPWLIYGELTVRDALSPVGTATMLASLATFTALFLALSITNWALLARHARRGPEGTQLGAGPAPEPVPAAWAAPVGTPEPRGEYT